MKVLGIDASTACVGWCLIDEETGLCDVSYLDLKKVKSLYEKLDMFLEKAKTYASSCCSYPAGVFVEAPLQRSNNQNVVNLLQRWNGMVCAKLYSVFHEPPTLITQRDALNSVGIIVPKGTKGLDRKKFILQYVQNLGIINESSWALKKTGTPKDFCYDQADAYVVAKAGSNLLCKIP